MPMIDAYIPEGALEAKAEARLFEELTEILIKHEGMDPADERVRNVTWIFLHRPKVYRGGVPAEQAIYRITSTVPEGQYTDQARAGLVKEVAEAVARAEGVGLEDVKTRIWIFPVEMPDGEWGSGGVIRHLPDIMEALGGGASRKLGTKRLAAKRTRDLIKILETALTLAKQGR